MASVDDAEAIPIWIPKHDEIGARRMTKPTVPRPSAALVCSGLAQSGSDRYSAWLLVADRDVPSLARRVPIR